jgi:hypothetical protein
MLASKEGKRIDGGDNPEYSKEYEFYDKVFER